MKNEMEGVFDLKVKEKIARLKESEVNVINLVLFQITKLILQYISLKNNKRQ